MNLPPHYDEEPPDLPSRKWLSFLATKLLSSNHLDLSPPDAVNVALDIWNAAGDRLTAEYQAFRLETEEHNPPSPSKEPMRHDDFPTDFETFLRKVVKGKTRRERENRYRAFLRQPNPFDGGNTPSEPEIESCLAKYRTNQIVDESEWNALAASFLKWWEPKKSLSAKKSAAARKKQLTEKRSSNPRRR